MLILQGITLKETSLFCLCETCKLQFPF